MSLQADPLRSAHRLAYGLGLALCLGTPGLVAALILSGAVPPGGQSVTGLLEQVGYLFSGTVFLSAAWVWWRLGQALRGFRALPEARRTLVIVRESLVAAAAFELSSLFGLAYWSLVGQHAARHAWGFVVLTPLLFLAVVPRFERWAKALEG